MSVLGSNQLKKDVDMLSKVIHLEFGVPFGVFSKRDQCNSEMTFTKWEKFCQGLSEPDCRLKYVNFLVCSRLHKLAVRSKEVFDDYSEQYSLLCFCPGSGDQVLKCKDLDDLYLVTS